MVDIYIAIDNHEIDKFKPVALALADRIEKENIGKQKSIKEYKIGNTDICILFSNRIKYIEELAKNISCDIVNVTDNLTSSHIVESLKYVKDIYYLKADMDTIMNRLATRLRFVESNTKGK